MATIEQLAQAALNGEALQLRALAQDWLREHRTFAGVPRPQTGDPTILAVAAGLVEMFASRGGQAPPAWTGEIAAEPEPVFLLREAQAMSRLRRLCQEQAPPALGRRRIYAPPDFLTFV